MASIENKNHSEGFWRPNLNGPAVVIAIIFALTWLIVSLLEARSIGPIELTGLVLVWAAGLTGAVLLGYRLVSRIMKTPFRTDIENSVEDPLLDPLEGLLAPYRKVDTENAAEMRIDQIAVIKSQLGTMLIGNLFVGLFVALVVCQDSGLGVEAAIWSGGLFSLVRLALVIWVKNRGRPVPKTVSTRMPLLTNAR